MVDGRLGRLWSKGGWHPPDRVSRMLTPKQTLKSYLQMQRDALLWKVEGLDERATRWPRTPTGTNLLGLLKHVGSVGYGYFGEVFGRPAHEPVPWLDADAAPNADMWASVDESKEWVVAFYRRAGAYADRTIDELDLDSPGRVPWWPPERRDVTLQQIMVHMIAETARHAGHADILRELTDGKVGHRAADSSMPDLDADWWADYVDMLRRTADEAAGRSS